MHRKPVLMGVDGHCMHAQLMSSSKDTNSNLGSVCYEQLVWLLTRDRRMPSDMLDLLLVGLIIEIVIVVECLVLEG